MRAGLAKWETLRQTLVVEEIPKVDTGRFQRHVMTERAVKLLEL